MTHKKISERRTCCIALFPSLAVMLIAACSSSDSVTNPPPSFKKNPCTNGAAVTLAVQQSIRVDCGNSGTTVSLAGGGASYLIVPEFATGNEINRLISYRMFSGAAAAESVASSRVTSGTAALSPNYGTDGFADMRPNLAQMNADRLLRARGRARWSTSVRTSQALTPRALAQSNAVPAVGSTRSFRVLSNFNTGKFTSVGATLAYVGTNVLIYIDTLSPPNGFSADQLQSFGGYFDATLYDIDTVAFGGPTDIDQNGHVIMMMSPVVNADTPATTCQTDGFVAGFFLEDDFDGPANNDSNHGEVFYSIVPDPSGTVSCAHSVDALGRDIPATFLHELQHLINYGQHVVVNGGSPGASWLDEGLSILSEELGSLYWESKCPPPSCRTNPAQLFPDSAQGFVQGFLYDSYQYALLPDSASLTLHNDSEGGFSWRGGDWLLLRWLTDQNGSGILKRLAQGPSDGIAAIETTTGKSFPDVFANFGLSLYMDSLPNLPRSTVPQALRFTTRNVKQLWARLYATAAGSDIPRPDPLQLFPVTSDSSLAVMVPGTTTFFRVDTPVNASEVTVEFSGPGGASFASTLKAQLAIIRLPAGQ